MRILRNRCDSRFLRVSDENSSSRGYSFADKGLRAACYSSYYSHAVAKGCGATRAYTCVRFINVSVYVRDRVRVCGMELCNGYRFWTLESRLMNTKHVNSRGKSV